MSERKGAARTIRLTDKQLEAWNQIAKEEDCTLVDAVKRGLKLLGKKHGIDWPKDRD